MPAKTLYAIGRSIVYLSDTTLGSIGFSALIGCACGIIAINVHTITERLGLPQGYMETADAALIGFFIGIITYVEISAVRERRRRVIENLRTVAELNHVLRNSLQAIQYAAKLSVNDQHAKIITDCVHRIDDAVRELFPVVIDPRRKRSDQAAKYGPPPPATDGNSSV